MSEFYDDIMLGGRYRHTFLIILDHFPTLNIHLKEGCGLGEFKKAGLHGVYQRMPNYGTQGGEELDRSMKRYYNSYDYICNINEHVMPNDLASTESTFCIFRNNIVRLFPDPDDDHMTTTSSKL